MTKAREAGLFDEALTMLDPILETQPQQLRALAELGRIRRAQGRHEAALAAFEAMLAIDPTAPQTLIDIAIELKLLRRNGEAEARLQEVLTRNPSHPVGLAELARNRRAAGDREGAILSFERALAANPSNASLQVELADELRQAGRLAEADERIHSVLVAHPDHVGALQELGRIARGRGDHAAAVDAFESAMRAEPNSEAVRIDLAASLRECGRLDQADTLLRTVLARSPNHFFALMGLGQICLRRSDRDGARAAYEAAVAASPGTGSAVNELAAALRDLGQIEEAERHLTSFLATDPRNVVALCGLATVKLERFELGAAEELYRRAAEIAPGNPAGVLGLGQLARRRGDRRAALEFFEQALVRHPTHPSAALERAAELCALGHYAEAERCLMQVPDDLHSAYQRLVQLAQLRRCQDRHQEALDTFAAAHDARPTVAAPLVDMAIEYRALGRPREAYELLRRAEKIEPSNLALLMQLAEHFIVSEDFESAVHTARQAIGFHPRKYRPYLMACRALSELGREEEAKAQLADATRLTGFHPEIIAAEAALLVRRREWNKAIAVLENFGGDCRQYACFWAPLVNVAILTGNYDKAESLLASLSAGAMADTARLFLLQGQLAEARWQLDAAAAHYREAIVANPNNGESHFELARVSLKLLDIDESRQHLQAMTTKHSAAIILRGQSLNISQNHLGQLIDEFTLDRPLLEKLQTIRRLPFAQQIAPLKEIVLVHPDHTPSAIMLLIAMRCGGEFSRGITGPFCGASTIPRRIVQYWNDVDPHDEIAEIMSSWSGLHPSFDYVRLDDLSAQDFLEAQRMDATLAAFQRIHEPAQRADLIRLAYLAVNGGFYADADDRCLVPVTGFVPSQAEFVSYQEDFGTLANNFLGVVPGHPVIALALQSATEALNRGDGDSLWLATGPGLVTRAFCHLLARNDPVALDRVTIMDRGYLQRHVGLHLPVAYKKSERHWSRSSFASGRRRQLRARRPADSK